MKWSLLVLVMAVSPSFGALSNFWATAGGFKMPRQDRLPYGNCSTCTITRNWNGDKVALFGAKNETLGFAIYMANATGSDILNVSVAISSFTGPVGSGIISTPVSLANTTNYINRPIEQFYVRYIQIKGMTQLSWDGTEYEMRDVPERMRRPCTVNVNNDCVANSGTLWTDRQDHDKFYPEILVPYEAVFDSSFTVSASSSQAVWFDVFVAPSLSSGTYTATITVKEGVTVSTRIPVEMVIHNFTLPDTPSLKSMVYMSNENINYRHYGNKFPASGNPYKMTRQKYAQFLKRHKFAATIGDNLASSCGQSGKNYPCPEYVERLNGSLFTNTSGYYNASGINTPDSIYSIGTYGNWSSASWSSTLTGGANGFCTNVSSWSAYFNNNFPNTRTFLYLTDEPAVFTNSDKWSKWMSSSCVLTHPIQSMVTGSAVDLAASAPNVNMPVSTTFLRASEATWQSTADAYNTNGSTQIWAYNSHPAHTGSVYATEDDGIAPITIFWSMFKKEIQGWFFWESTYWTDTGNDNIDNDLWNDAMTFGERTSVSSTKGSTGFQYSNGDGVLLYPGTDVIGTVNYGVDGPMASWRLKMLRRGIQDGDYMILANAVSPVATSSIVSGMVPEVLWEHACFEPSDCTYAYGGRSWTNDPDAWEDAREDLADLIDANPPDEEDTDSCVFRGPFRMGGGIRIP